jgi:hypothetical protein
MNMRTLLLLVIYGFATASFESCSSSAAVTITQLVADPPDVVAAGQPVTMEIRFTVPQGTWIPSGTLRVSTTLNYVPVDTWDESLCKYVHCPLTAGEHTVVLKQNFPDKVWGLVVADAVATNSSGAPLLCARWRVRATGTNTNKTGSWF